mgnify:CR=1 FL=1
MYLIGDFLTKQSIKYRHLRSAGPDGSTVLIVALPLRKDQKAKFDNNRIEAQMMNQINDVINQQPSNEMQKPIGQPLKTIRNMVRKQKGMIIAVEENDE